MATAALDAACQGKPNGTPCDDGNQCTQTDTCSGGVCTGSNPISCGVSDQCHSAGSCAPATGKCTYPNLPNGVACFDANECTQNDKCQNGACTGTAIDTAPLCDQVACRSIQRLRATGMDMCVELAGGRVDCWGDASQNWGANGPSMLLPTFEPALTGARDFGNSFSHSCVVQADGTVKCWGQNDFGQLGDGTNTAKPEGVLVSGISNAVRVWLTPYSSCALLADQSLMCWGDNRWGQVGDGTTTARNLPVRVLNHAPVAELATNSTGVVALLTDNTVEYWGQIYNNAVPGVPNRATPTLIPELNGATQVALGMDHLCAVLSGGVLKCAGDNVYGALGNGSFTSAATPAPVPGLPPVKKVGAGYLFTCALLVDGTARCWGFGGHATFGTDRRNLTPAEAASPVPVLGVNGATDLVTLTGGFNTCVLMNGCSVECWGSEGGMGIGTSAIQSPRVPRPALIPTELNSLSVTASCRVPSSSQALFIAKNSASVTIDSPVGQYNHFDDTPSHQQPQSFAPGVTVVRAPVPSSGSVSWTLGVTTNQVGASTPACTLATSDGQTTVTIGGSTYDVGGTLALIDVCRIPAATPNAPDEAVFVYDNSGVISVSTTKGVDNQFDGDADRGQPSSFAPGKGAFRTTLDPDGTSWTLGDTSLVASATTPACAISQHGVNDTIELGGNSYDVPPVGPALQAEPPVGEPFTGMLTGTFGVSPSGASTFKVPLALPPAIHGMGPVLSLDYNSQGDNGIAGQGFSLSGLSTIYRCPKTLHQDGRSLQVSGADDDAYCLDGNHLFARPDGSFVTEGTDFSRITLAKDETGRIATFTVETKAGEVHKYGSRAESRFASAAGYYLVWGLDEVRDLSDNYFLVHYNEGNTDTSSGLLPSSFEYTGHGAVAPGTLPNKVRLIYEERPDRRMAVLGDRPLVKKLRLHAVATRAGWYFLDYEQDNVGYPSRLLRVRFCDGTNCMRPLEFGWDQRDPAWTPDLRWSLPDGIGFVSTYRDGKDNSQQDEGYQLVDLTGDGLPELLAGKATNPLVAYENLGAGGLQDNRHWKKHVEWGLPTDHGGAVLVKNDGGDGGARLMDVDGDGLVDIVAGQNSIASPYAIRVWLNRLRGTPGGWVFSPELSLQLPGIPNSHGQITSYPGMHFDGLDRLVDIDGDGLTDVFSFNSGEVRLGLPGGGWSKTPSVTYKVPSQIIAGATPASNLLHDWAAFFFGDSTRGKLGHLSDVNNDGLVDIVLQRGDLNLEPIDYTTDFDVWINTGKGQWQNTMNSVRLPGLAADGDAIWNTDLNADGYPDTYRFALEYNNFCWYWNTGIGDACHPYTGWNNFDDVAFGTPSGRGNVAFAHGFQGMPSIPISSEPPPLGSRYYPNVTDINADGLPDLLIAALPEGPSFRVLMNRGTYFTEKAGVQLPIMPVNESNALIKRSNPHRNGVVFADLNGDHMPDIVEGHWGGPQSYINTGTAPVIRSFPDRFTTISTTYSYTTQGAISLLGLPLYTAELDVRPNDKPMTSPLRVVASVSREQPVAGEMSSTKEIYAYAGLRVSSRGRGTEGFHTISVIDTARGIRTDTEYLQVYPYTGRVRSVKKTWWAIRQGDQNTDISTTLNEYCDNVDLENDVHQSTCADNVIGRGESPNTPLFVVPKSTLDTAILPNSTDQVVTTTTWKYDHAGNLTNTNTALVGSNGEHTSRTIVNDYGIEQDSNWFYVHGRPLATTVTMTADGTDSLTHYTKFAYYDDQSHLLKEKQEEAGAGYPLEKHTLSGYDEFGNNTQTTICTNDWSQCTLGGSSEFMRSSSVSFDPADFTPPLGSDASLVTRLDYPRGLFAVKTTNPLNQSEYYAYEDLHGVLLQKTLVNGVTMRQYPDDIGRIRKVVDRAGTPGAVVSTTDTFLVPEALPGGARTVTVNRAPNGVATFTYADGLSRTVEVKTQAFDGSFTVVDSEYDVLGRAHRVSEPSAAAPPLYWTTTEFDGLDRVLSITKDLGDIDGSGERSTTVFSDRVGFTTMNTQNVTLIRNGQAREEREVQKIEVKNVAGQVERSFQPLGGADEQARWAEVDFTYDAEGRLTEAWEAGTGETLAHAVYDLRGRKRDSYDTDTGNWSYTYTGFGQLQTQTDAIGQTTSHEYDALDRMVRQTTTDANGQQKTARWYYDIAEGAGIGKLAAMEGQDEDALKDSCPIGVPGIQPSAGKRATRWFRYNAFGDQLEQHDCIDGEIFSTSYAYDGLGRLETTTYPKVQGNDFSVRYSYSPSGHLLAVSDASDASTVYWAARARDARGNVTQEFLKSGVETQRSRNGATGWLRSQTDVAHGDADTVLQNAAYDYNEVGSLLRRSRSDSLSQVVDNYGYDRSDRLYSTQTLDGSGAEVASDAPRYDDFGNITSKAGHAFHYGGCAAAERAAGIHAICQVDAGPMIVYDGNGNLAQDANHTAVFNVGNKATHIANLPGPSGLPSASVDLVYGPSGQRVVQSLADASGETARTIYVGLDDVGKTLYERTTRGSSVEHTQYLFADGGHPFGLRVIHQSAGSTELRFYHRDHLGSVVAVSDEDGVVSAADQPSSPSNLAYDAWGARRHTDGTPAAASEFTADVDHRGFTAHEMIPALALVNMNGRVYDPELGRFLSPDSEVQFAGYLQSYNRYSYVLNNPLRYTDPTGHRMPGETAKFLKVVSTIVTVAACATGYACAPALVGSAALNAYIMQDSGVSTGRIVAVTAVTTAAAIVGAGVGSGAASAMGLEGGSAAVASGAIGGATQAAITSAVFDRGHMGQNVLMGGAMGAGMSGLRYAFQQTPPLSQAQESAEKQASRDALRGRQAGEAMRESSRMTSYMAEVARDTGPHPIVADNEVLPGSSLADVPFCNSSPCVLPPACFDPQLTYHGLYIPAPHRGVMTLTLGVDFGFTPLGRAYSVGLAWDTHGGFAALWQSGNRTGLNYGLSLSPSFSAYPAMTTVNDLAGSYTQWNLDTPIGSLSYSPNSMIGVSPPTPFPYVGVTFEQGSTNLKSVLPSYLIVPN